MDCAEIRDGFASGSIPEGPAVAQHLRLCPQCRELFEKGAALGRRLARAVSPVAVPGDLFGAVERDLQAEVGMRAGARALPSWLRAGGLWGVGVLWLALHLVFRRRPDFQDFGAAAFWGVALVFGAALLLGSWRLARGASLPAQGEGRLGLLLLAVPVLLSLLAPWVAPASAVAGDWGSPTACFNYGAAIVIPFLLLAWLFERRDAIPLPALLLTGACAGVVANLLLHAHCPSAHLGHLLLGHASIGVAWALGLGLLSRGLQRRG